MSYDAFSNLTSRSNTMYGGFPDDFSASYISNRKYNCTTTDSCTNDTYDAAGNVVQSIFTHRTCLSSCRDNDGTKKWNFDAAGRVAHWEETGPWDHTLPEDHRTHREDSTYDGDGRLVKKYVFDENPEETWYYLYSSVTGQKITDLQLGDGSGFDSTDYVYMGDTVIDESHDSQGSFKVTDPVTGSTQRMESDGSVSNDELSRTEMAGFDTSVPLPAPDSYPPPPHHAGDPGDAEFGCITYWNGMEVKRRACTHAQLAGADDVDWNWQETIILTGQLWHKGSRDGWRYPATPGHKPTWWYMGQATIEFSYATVSFSPNPFSVRVQERDELSNLPLLPRPRIPYEIPIDYAKRYAYEKYGAIFNDCLRKVFKKAFEKVGEQTLANSPELRTDFTGEQLSARLKEAQANAHLEVTKDLYITGLNDPNYGSYGAVAVAQQNYNGTRGARLPLAGVVRDIAMIYFHETANILSQRATQSEFTFGKKGYDADSGHQVEECMTNKLAKAK